ncbi:MAG: DUF1385 domain-containing protein [Solirubrobacterales bacterium]
MSDTPASQPDEMPPEADAAPEGEPLRLGGMALRNGLLIHGPTSWAAAVRDTDGEIHVGSGRKPSFAPDVVGRAPFLRGPVKLAEAFAVLPLVRMRLPAARLPFESPAVAASAGGSILLTSVVRRGGPPSVGRELAASVLGLVPAVTALRGSQLASYHGVEHKAIGAYEQGSMDPRTATKEHDRCGSNLLAPMLALTAAGQLLLESLPMPPGVVVRGAVTAGAVSGAVEAFTWSERHPDSALARAFHAPGQAIQQLFATREPDEDQIEVGIAALREALRAEGVDA